MFPNVAHNWFEGYGAVLFIMTFACTTNHVVFLRNALHQIDYQTIEAARNMGASTSRILFKVVLPTLAPSYLSITILTFIKGLCAMAAPLIVGGTQFQTINPVVITFVKMDYTRTLGSVLSIFLGLISFALLMGLNYIERRGHYMSISKVKTRIVKQKIKNPVLNVLMHVLLPIIVPTILALWALEFNGTLGEYDISVLLAPTTVNTLGVTIKTLTTDNYDPNSTAVSFVYAVIMMVIAGLVVYFVYGRKGTSNNTRKTKRMVKHIEELDLHNLLIAASTGHVMRGQTIFKAYADAKGYPIEIHSSGSGNVEAGANEYKYVYVGAARAYGLFTLDDYSRYQL